MLRAVAVVGAAQIGAIPSSEKGQPNGVASLDGSGKIPTSQMPVGDVTYKGNWNATTNTPTLANGTGVAGDLHICDVAGTQNLGAGSVAYGVGDWLIYDGTVWDVVQGHGPAPANPSVTVGLTAKNGTADTFMRSDAAPALDQAIAPTWTGAHTFTQTTTAQAINATAVAGNTSVKAGIGSNSVQMNGAANGVDPVIEALGVTDANVSLQFKAKGTGLLKLESPIAVTGAATFSSSVAVAGQLGSANNTSLPSPTNSGITIGGNPTWAMASFYDQAVTANNRTADLLFITNSIKFRFANDARNAFLDVLTINGGQALGVTGVTSTSGSGAWAHTGSYTASSDVSAGEGMAASLRMVGGTTGQAATLQSYGSTPDVSLRVSTKGSAVIALNSGGVDRLTISTGNLLAGTGYAPADALSLATKGYVDGRTAAAQANSTATDVAGLVADFNSLLAKLRTAGLLAT